MTRSFPIRLLALAAMLLVGLPTLASAQPAAPSLDDPPVSLAFQRGSGLKGLNLAISQYLAKRPGLTRYAEFEAQVDGPPDVVLPDAFTGSIEQLVKSVACINRLGYRDFSPSGVVFVRASPAHPIPYCPTAVSDDEVRRKAATLPGAAPALHLPGRRPGDLDRLFPGFSRPGQSGMPPRTEDDGSGNAPAH